VDPGDVLFLPGGMLHPAVPRPHGDLPLAHLARRRVPFFPGPGPCPLPDSDRARLCEPVAVTVAGTDGRAPAGVRLVAGGFVRPDYGTLPRHAPHHRSLLPGPVLPDPRDVSARSAEGQAPRLPGRLEPLCAVPRPVTPADPALHLAVPANVRRGRSGHVG